MHTLCKNTHADRYLDSTIFDPQSGSGTTLLQTEKICTAVPDRIDKYACMFCGPSTTVAIPEAYTCQGLASLYTLTLQPRKRISQGHREPLYLTQVTYVFMRNCQVDFPQNTAQYNRDYQKPTVERSKASRGLSRCRSHVRTPTYYCVRTFLSRIASKSFRMIAHVVMNSLFLPSPLACLTF